jgi:hypothetical protein
LMFSTNVYKLDMSVSQHMSKHKDTNHPNSEIQSLVYTQQP